MDLYVGIDFETANAHRVSACSIGLAIPGPTTSTYPEPLHVLLRPPRGFDAFKMRNVAVHGIYREDVLEADEFPTVYEELVASLDERHVFAAHNAPFDYSVLRALCDYYDLPFPANRWVCTLRTARRVMPLLENHRLPTVAAALDLPAFSHHHAGEDAFMTAAIAARCASAADTYLPRRVVSA